MNTTLDLNRIDLTEGWSRKQIADDLTLIEARDPAEQLNIPLSVTGQYALQLDFFTYANRRAVGVQFKLASQDIWQRVRPMRFIDDGQDAIQSANVATLDVQLNDALQFRTEPICGIALSKIELLRQASPDKSPIAGDRAVGFVHDTNMSMSKFTINQPTDLYSILQPYVDSHVTHIFFGTGVGTYSPLYDSTQFGWHGDCDQEFWATHRERTAHGMRLMKAAGTDPLRLAVDFAHENGLQLWANHRISKNHEHDFRDQYAGGRFLLEHRDKLVLESNGKAHHQTLLSHAYPEIRAATVQMIVDQAKYDVDGIYIDFRRKPPIVGWEAKSVEDFQEKHGFDPLVECPPDFTAKWLEHLCSYPTQLLRELREALKPIEQEIGRRMPIAVNVSPGWRFTSGQPSCMLDGLDPFTWANEGLVDIVIPSHDLWLQNDCLYSYIREISKTNCEVWGAIGPQTRDAHRSRAQKEQFNGEGENECADTDPWRYLQSAHDFYSQGATGVSVWESQDIPSVPQVWNTIKHRIGNFELLCKTFGDKLGLHDGSDKFPRRFL